MADICIFAGQGAQVPGMGKDFAQDPEIMALFEKANAVLDNILMQLPPRTYWYNRLAELKVCAN